jgi:hypothetical protein
MAMGVDGVQTISLGQSNDQNLWTALGEVT